MSRPLLYEASKQQIQDAYVMSDDRAQRISHNLAELFVPAHAYYQLEDQINGPDVGRIAHELSVRLLDAPETSSDYQLAPYVLDGARIIRGIALWTRRQDITRPPAARSIYKTELVQA